MTLPNASFTESRRRAESVSISSPATSRARPVTTFVTFYSFKGGVGRTMALLNSASILAGRGRRVLMIDFDLEAPGLTTLREIKSGTQKEGVVEMVREMIDHPEASPFLSNNKKQWADRFVIHLDIPKHGHRSLPCC